MIGGAPSAGQRVIRERSGMYVGVQSGYVGKDPEISSSLPEKGARPMSVDENKALVRRFFESGYQEAHEGNLDVVHQYFADHFHDHTSLHP